MRIELLKTYILQLKEDISDEDPALGSAKMEDVVLRELREAADELVEEARNEHRGDAREGV